MDLPESIGRRYHGRPRLRPAGPPGSPGLHPGSGRVPNPSDSKKGGPKAALVQKPLEALDQFAALAGLSLAAFSAVVGAVGLTLTPCSRSDAIFKALSSL